MTFTAPGAALGEAPRECDGVGVVRADKTRIADENDAMSFSKSEGEVMAEHESPPRLCAGCIDTIHSMLARREQVDYYYCEHYETLALLGVADHRIVHWSLYGQVSPNEAADLLAKSLNLSRLVDGLAETGVVH